jgi:RNA polymerase sigma-70 factor (ECF subfamily)
MMAEVYLNDAELMARVAQRNRDALESLYDRHAGVALGLAVKILGERATGEEIVQEAFWRVWQRAATFDHRRGDFSGWLLSIVYHLAIDELRRRRGQPPRAVLDANSEQTFLAQAGATDVTERAWSNVEHAQVREAVTRLPEPQRAVIELAYFEGLTRQEIAARLNEPLGTIHTRARLALAKLRDSLANLRTN